MAAYSVAVDEVGVYAKVLVANVVDTVTFTRDCDRVEVMNETGVAPISFTVDGRDPTVAGNHTHYLPAAIGALEVNVPGAGMTVIKLIAASPTSYGVVAVD